MEAIDKSLLNRDLIFALAEQNPLLYAAINHFKAGQMTWEQALIWAIFYMNEGAKIQGAMLVNEFLIPEPGKGMREGQLSEWLGLFEEPEK